MNVFRHGVDVRCSRAHAFAVFTNRIDAWWPPSHRRVAGSRLELEPKVDGLLVERGADGTDKPLGRVTEWTPTERIVLAWFLGAPPDAPTLVEITFAVRGEHTRVEVVHGEGAAPLPDWHHTVQIFERAWTHVLGAFQPAAETTP